jgi:tetratricopeptide (TPR) repeat protein
MKTIIAAAAVILVSTSAFAQDRAQLQRLFEAGKFQQVVEGVSADSSPEAVYTAAQSHQKLGAAEQASELYRQLASRPEDDTWHFIGQSAQQLIEDNTEAALDSARQAVSMAGDSADAHYQLGLVLAKRQSWGDAAAEFDRVAEIEPGTAYAHYYGGLMHYRAGRPDRMAIAFEQFLKLAPEAPERPEVLQIMRTVRGR